MEQIVRKNGLLYTPDLHTVLGVDVETDEFKGRIPFGAHYVDEEVFTECPYEKIDLPDSVVGIGVALFKDSPNLKSVRLPEKVTDAQCCLFFPRRLVPELFQLTGNSFQGRHPRASSVCF